MTRFALSITIACFVVGCDRGPREIDADVVVVGAGIAGISAALEASAAGANVLVIERSSVAGGHAVRAGGLAMVATPLQLKKGYVDSPELAIEELTAWGEDADAAWVRQFAERSRIDVYDWLSELGIRFNILLATPEGSVPRFHFAGGPAVNVIVPMLREALQRKNIRWLMNAAVDELFRTDGDIVGIRARSTRGNRTWRFETAAVVLATGGFQSNLDLVREHWPDDLTWPDRILLGVGPHATGDGLRLGANLGAGTTRLNDQVTFVNGLPNPRRPERALHVSNPASIWVDANGRRFVNEAASTKITESAVLASAEQTFWMVFDARGRRKLRIRDAEWLNPASIAAEILDNPDIAGKAETLAQLAEQVGLPADMLAATVERYNAMVTAGIDQDFQRFDADDASKAKALDQPPFYALRLFPMTRKNLGGLAVDVHAQALTTAGQAIPGLFAAGELTGVAGINGSHGGSGTFLAPSVLMGRVAGRGAAEHAVRSDLDSGAFGSRAIPADPPTTADIASVDPNADLSDGARDGYVHFDEAHSVVSTREYACDYCHSGDWPVGPALTVEAQLKQLESCTSCH